MDDIPNRPFTLILEPASGCNLDCRYCYTHTHSGRIMDRKTLTIALRKGIAYALDEGFEEIHILWHGGEPLLAGVDFFRYALQRITEIGGDKACRHFIQTNGLLADEAFCRLFRRHGFEVGLSLDGPADIHDHMRIGRRGGKTHARVLKCLELFERNGVKPGICAVASRIGLGEEMRIYEFFRNLGYGFGVNPMIPSVNDPASGQYLFKSGEYGRFLCNLFDLWTATATHRVNVGPLDIFIRGLVTGETVLCQQQTSCVGASLYVKSDGRTQLCNRSEQPVLGHIVEHSVRDMFKTTFCRDLQHREEQLPACRKCRYQQICHGGCPQLAMTFEGACSSPDPFCRDYRAVWDHMRRSGVEAQFRRAV